MFDNDSFEMKRNKKKWYVYKREQLFLFLYTRYGY